MMRFLLLRFRLEALFRFRQQQKRRRLHLLTHFPELLRPCRHLNLAMD